MNVGRYTVRPVDPILLDPWNITSWFCFHGQRWQWIYKIIGLKQHWEGTSSGPPVNCWNSKQPVFYGCFNWMIPNHYKLDIYIYIKHCCFTKHPLKNGCLGYQVYINVIQRGCHYSKGIQTKIVCVYLEHH